MGRAYEALAINDASLLPCPSFCSVVALMEKENKGGSGYTLDLEWQLPLQVPHCYTRITRIIDCSLGDHRGFTSD